MQMTKLMFTIANNQIRIHANAAFLPSQRNNLPYDYIIKWCFGIRCNVIGVYRWIFPKV